MANHNVTLQTPSCKENSSTSQQQTHKPRELTILKAARDSQPQSNRSHLEYRPIVIEPYTLLRGQWLEKAGFSIGQKITVQVSHQQLIITPSETLLTEL